MKLTGLSPSVIVSAWCPLLHDGFFNVLRDWAFIIGAGGGSDLLTVKKWWPTPIFFYLLQNLPLDCDMCPFSLPTPHWDCRFWKGPNFCNILSTVHEGPLGGKFRQLTTVRLRVKTRLVLPAFMDLFTNKRGCGGAFAPSIYTSFLWNDTTLNPWSLLRYDWMTVKTVNKSNNAIKTGFRLPAPLPWISLYRWRITPSYTVFLILLRQFYTYFTM